MTTGLTPAMLLVPLILSLVLRGLEPIIPPLLLAGEPLAGDLAVSTELDLEPGFVYKLDVDLDFVSPPPPYEPDSLRGDLVPPATALDSNNFRVSRTVSGAGSSRSFTPNKRPADTGFINDCLLLLAVVATPVRVLFTDPVDTLLVGLVLTDLIEDEIVRLVVVEDDRKADVDVDVTAVGFTAAADNNKAADFLAGKRGELVAELLEITMFSLTRAGLQDRTWLTGRGGGTTGSAFDSLRQH